MNEAVETTGKTVEDALEQALKILGVSKDQIGYKIIEQPSKGVLGFFSKPAKLQVWVSKNESVNEVQTVAESITQEDNSQNNLSTSIESFDAQVATTRSVSAENTAIDHSETLIDENIPVEFSLESQKPKIDRAVEFLQGVFDNMNMEVKITTEKKNSNYIISLSGDKLGILIGKRGQTLDALQYLTNLAANKNVAYENRAKFIIDVENYRAKREATLKELATHLAERVIRTKTPTKLEPMNRYERKVIHLALQENTSVTTYSEGDEPFRRIVIAPKK